ncbi:hypothetical protein RPMA_02255 [Tardiphaga alba]|uniref:Uncharacterized protein n=1 Tax=Tardiphaga alba TaxID=340268 RepID=A0ABX8A2Q1_9BRAD|nr:hypothetical protein [Tardiphaga alba]QUS37816.1 hypothetical protein RPMA_02255 [Tardiphaga alba]
MAQTSPPPLDTQALENVQPTAVTRVATGFSLGAFAGNFEQTTLGAVRNAVGSGTIQNQGDAGGSTYWLCYRDARYRLWVVSGGEIGGSEHLITEIVQELTAENTDTATDCATLPERFSSVVLDKHLRLGISRSEAMAALGPPSKLEATQTAYFRQDKLANGFEETAWLILEFREELLVSMRSGKTTTN